MQTVLIFAAVFAAAASMPLRAQDAGAGSSSQESKNVNYTQGPMGFGDASASHAWEMSNVTCELEKKLDAKSAKVGDQVVLKTTEKVLTADGTVIPRGTRLIGRITQVQLRDSTHSVAELGIAFDQAQLKNGQSLAIFTLIRGVNPPPSLQDMNPLNNADPTSAMNSQPAAGGGRGGRGGGGGQSGILGDAVQRTSQTTTSVNDRANANNDTNPEGAVQLAGHGDLSDNTGAHQQAAARAIPRPTAIPGLLLAGNSSASGVLLAQRRDIELDSGTELQLGIIVNR